MRWRADGTAKTISTTAGSTDKAASRRGVTDRSRPVYSKEEINQAGGSSSIPRYFTAPQSSHPARVTESSSTPYANGDERVVGDPVEQQLFEVRLVEHVG
jgi:hypothetical protein